jgi:glycosyltransferase involved in cell wall biosynthesis
VKHYEEKAKGMRRALVTYTSAQDLAPLAAARGELWREGGDLEFLHYSKVLGLPRRPNLLAHFALEEVRILMALAVRRYDIAIIPAQLTRPHLLRLFLLAARLNRVHVYMYWHDCAWIIEKIRDRVGPKRFEKTSDLICRSEVDHLVLTPRTFHDVSRTVGVTEAHYTWSSVPDEVDDSPSPLPADDPPIVVNVASMQLRKAPELFVDVARYVCAQHPRVELIWVGGEASAELRHYICSSGLQDRVKFVGWSEEPRSWIRKSSALLLTSRSEAFGLVVAEAFAASRTVVTFGETGASEAVGDAGEVVAPFDTIGAGEAVLEALRAPANSRINLVARRRYETLFSPKIYGRRLAQVLAGSSEWLLRNQPTDQPQNVPPVA